MTDEHPPYSDDDAPPDEQPTLPPTDMAVARRLYELRVNELAREKFAAEKAGPPVPFDAGTLAEILTRAAPPPPRVDGLMPADASTLLTAMRKKGKTTTELNLARSAITGQDFLGRFGVRKLDGNAALLNFEVSGHQIARWAQEHQIPGDRLFVVNLRGVANPFKSPTHRQRLAQLLREHDTEMLMVDPFGRAYPGENQNDSGEVGAWLQELDMFGRTEVGSSDIVLAAHAGWNGERTRGSSALEDWADSIITITGEKALDDQRRYLRAEGRDVLVEEDQLLYDPATRTLTLAGTGSRRIATNRERIEGLVPYVRTLLEQAPPPGLSGNKIDQALKDKDLPHQKGDGAKAAQILHENGEATSAKKGNATVFTLISPNSPELPQGETGELPHLPLKGEVSTGKEPPPTSPRPKRTTA